MDKCDFEKIGLIVREELERRDLWRDRCLPARCGGCAFYKTDDCLMIQRQKEIDNE